MTNYEYFKDELIDLVGRSRCIAVVNGKPTDCAGTMCEQCEIYAGSGETCRPKRKAWLYAEHIEMPKLTKKERQFCELIETGWIARDENGGLYHYKNKPHKGGYEWLNGSFDINIRRFPDVPFSFITWDDKESWSVEELLKLEYERSGDSLGACGEQ